MKLTPKQKLFVDEYLVDLNATRAYKAAGYSVRSDNAAAVEGHKLLRNPKINNCIKQRMHDREKRTEVTQDKVVEELAKIAFSEITDYVTVSKQGGYLSVKIKPTEDIPKEKRGALAAIKQGTNGIEIKTNDKVKALELLGRHLGIFNDKTEISGDIGLKVVVDYGED